MVETRHAVYPFVLEPQEQYTLPRTTLFVVTIVNQKLVPMKSGFISLLCSNFLWCKLLNEINK